MSYALRSIENENGISGSGFILHDLDNEETEHLGNITFVDCSFIGNNAGLGSAIHLQNIKVDFTNLEVSESDTSCGS